MLKIYSVPISLYSAKVRIALRHKGLAWREEEPPGGYGSNAYKKLVPSGNIPALLDGDTLIADSEAITEYLNETRPDPPMLPAEPGARARVRERSRFHDTRLEPEVRAAFPHLRSGNRPDRFLENRSAAINEKLRQLAALLAQSPPGTGDGLTLADCGYPATFAWADALSAALELAFDWPDRVVAYRSYLEGHSAVAEELARYRPAISDWIAQ